MFQAIQNLFRKKSKNKIPPTVLLMLDGFGLAPMSPGNAILSAKTPVFNKLYENYLWTQLIASGESVGLPANEVGNSEVGHLTIGSGRAVLQSLPRIQKTIDRGGLMYNPALVMAADWVGQNQSSLHLVGLLSSGEVHASFKHLDGLLLWAKQQKISKVFLHLFTDGRDAPLQDGLNQAVQIEKKLLQYPQIKIASISGRYYGMDRDGRWERARLVCLTMLQGQGKRYFSASAALTNYYQEGITDEFIPPTVIAPDGTQPAVIADGDCVLFFNFRADRARQLALTFVRDRLDTEALTNLRNAMGVASAEREAEWQALSAVALPKSLKVITLTQYHAKLPVDAVAFPIEIVNNPLSEVVMTHGFEQAHLAESEKERMVAYYFDGLRDVPFKGEMVEIVASPRVKTYDLKPEMSLPTLTEKILAAIRADRYFLVVANFANPDMVAHSGNLPATIQAIEHVDKAVGRIVETTLALGGRVLITADHGNAEEMLTFPADAYFFTGKTGQLNTEHSDNPVPFIIVDPALERGKVTLNPGALSDVAPTLLSLWGWEVPKEMTGKSLINRLT